ncbi:MAG: MotA/TolQ/ExbB proton channel family protein [Balneolales bacterium]
MDKSTIFGLLSALVVVFMAIATQGSLWVFLSLSSFLIVIGGVFSVTIVNFSYTEVIKTFESVYENLRNSKVDLRTDIELINMFARKARRDGMLALEDDLHKIDDSFLRNGLLSVMDGLKKETLLNILNDQLENAERVMERGIRVLGSMADYSPAFGMMGTVIGLVLMLQNIEDPESLGHGLAIALLTTLYGTLLANIFFLPLSGKLDTMSEKHLTRKRMFKSAIVSIIEEENPRIMEDKMLIYLVPAERAAYLAYYDKETFDKAREERLYENWDQYQNKSWQHLVENMAIG